MADLPSEFKLERFFDKYEFTTKYLLCCSDAEPLTMKELLEMADEECKVGSTKKASYLLSCKIQCNHPRQIVLFS